MVIYAALFTVGMFVGGGLFWASYYIPLYRKYEKLAFSSLKTAEQNMKLIKICLGVPVFEQEDGKFISPIQPHGNN